MFCNVFNVMFAGAKIAPRFLTTTFTGYVLENQKPGPQQIKLDVILDANRNTTLTYVFDQTPCNGLYVIKGEFDGQHKCKFCRFFINNYFTTYINGSIVNHIWLM